MHDVSPEDSLFVISVVPMPGRRRCTSLGRTPVAPEQYLTAIKQYQRSHSGYDLPSETKIRAELFYYRANIFEKLFPYYATAGLVMIFTIITLIIRGKDKAPGSSQDFDRAGCRRFLFPHIGTWDKVVYLRSFTHEQRL